MSKIITTVIFILSFKTLLSKPIQKEIDSVEMIKKVGFLLETIQRKENSRFEITWSQPLLVQNGNKLPRLDLILGEINKNDPIIHIRYPMNKENICYADFTLSADQYAKATLIFKVSNQLEYTLKLSDCIDKFKRFQYKDPI